MAPGWETQAFPPAGAGLRVLAGGRAGDAAAGVLALHADAAVLAGRLAAGTEARLTLAPGRAAYLVALGGAIAVNGVAAGPRDGVAVSGETALAISKREAAEIVVVDVAG